MGGKEKPFATFAGSVDASRISVDGMVRTYDETVAAYCTADESLQKLLMVCMAIPDQKGADKPVLDMQMIRRQRRVAAHPGIRVVRDPSDPQRQVIMVAPQTKLSPLNNTLENAKAAATGVYEGKEEEYDEESHRVGAALSKFSNTCMRAFVGDALKPNSRYRYGKPFKRSRVKTLREQLQLLPQPVQTAMTYAVKEFWQELNAMPRKDRRYALYRATTNAYKAMNTHTRRNIANIKKAIKKRHTNKDDSDEDEGLATSLGHIG